MSIPAAVLDAMVAAGASADVISAAVKADQATTDAKLAQARERAAARQRAKRERERIERERHAQSQDVTRTERDDNVTSRDATPPPSMVSLTLSSLTTPSPSALRLERSSAREADDWPADYREQFWKRYPRQIAKKAAIRKLEQVRKSGDVTFAALMAAVDRYAAANPDPQFVKHPERWLNAGCWDDDPTALARAGPVQQPMTAREQKQQEFKDVRAEIRAYATRASSDPGRPPDGVLPNGAGERPAGVRGGSDRAPDLLSAVDRRTER